jgi:hypothetical protein
MKDMGPGLLHKGIYIYSTDLADYLEKLPTAFWQGCKTISLDGREAAPGMLQNGRWLPESKMVQFSVVTC